MGDVRESIRCLFLRAVSLKCPFVGVHTSGLAGSLDAAVQMQKGFETVWLSAAERFDTPHKHVSAEQMNLEEYIGSFMGGEYRKAGMPLLEAPGNGVRSGKHPVSLFKGCVSKMSFCGCSYFRFSRKFGCCCSNAKGL